MIQNERTTAVIIQRGNYFFGHTTRKQNGTIADHKPPEWKPDPAGASVAVSEFDTEKNEYLAAADLFAAWDTDGIQRCVREKLALNRGNFPAPEELYKWAKNNEDSPDLCEICEGVCAGYDCSVCPVNTIKTEAEGAE